MPRLFRPLLLLALVAAVGCDSGASFDISPYVGTYVGTRAEVSVPDDGGEPTEVTERLTVTLAANEAAGTVTLTLSPEGGPPELLAGSYNDGGIRIRFAQADFALSFDAAPDGTVTGSYRAADQNGELTGTLTPSRFDLSFQPADADGTRTEIRTRR